MSCVFGVVWAFPDSRGSCCGDDCNCDSVGDGKEEGEDGEVECEGDIGTPSSSSFIRWLLFWPLPLDILRYSLMSPSWSLSPSETGMGMPSRFPSSACIVLVAFAAAVASCGSCPSYREHCAAMAG